MYVIHNDLTITTTNDLRLLWFLWSLPCVTGNIFISQITNFHFVSFRFANYSKPPISKRHTCDRNVVTKCTQILAIFVLFYGDLRLEICAFYSYKNVRNRFLLKLFLLWFEYLQNSVLSVLYLIFWETLPSKKFI